MDETMIENSFESLQKALNYINLILNEVHFNMNDKEILPELQKPYLIYVCLLLLLLYNLLFRFNIIILREKLIL